MLFINSFRPGDAKWHPRSVNIGSGNGLLPIRRHAVTSINSDFLPLSLIETNYGDISTEIAIFSLKKMHLKTSSVKRWSFCPSNTLLARTCECLTWKLLTFFRHWLTSTWVSSSRRVSYCENSWILEAERLCIENVTAIGPLQTHIAQSRDFARFALSRLMALWIMKLFTNLCFNTANIMVYTEPNNRQKAMWPPLSDARIHHFQMTNAFVTALDIIALDDSTSSSLSQFSV